MKPISPSKTIRTRFKRLEDVGYPCLLPPMEAGAGCADCGCEVVFIPRQLAESRTVPLAKLGLKQRSRTPQLFKAVDRYAQSIGAVSALPKLERTRAGQTARSIEIVLLSSAIARRERVVANNLENGSKAKGSGGPGNVLKQDRLLTRGETLLLVFPEQDDAGRGRVMHHVTGHASAVIPCRMLPVLIGMYDRFDFTGSFTVQEKAAVLEANATALCRSLACTALTYEERDKLYEVYAQFAVHYHEMKPPRDRVYASTGIRDNNTYINRSLFFGLPPDEQAMTIIHEMMHVAGYRHADERPAAGTNAEKEYFKTPPLRAEICIAGRQS